MTKEERIDVINKRQEKLNNILKYSTKDKKKFGFGLKPKVRVKKEKVSVSKATITYWKELKANNRFERKLKRKFNNYIRHRAFKGNPISDYEKERLMFNYNYIYK